MRHDQACNRMTVFCLALLTCGLLSATLMLLPCSATAKGLTLAAEVAHPYLLQGEKQITYLKVGLQAAKQEDALRTPVNIAIVLDRSGSMNGEKLARAKEAAKMAIERLRPDDIVAVVAYNQTVNVLVPATRASNQAAIFSAIDDLSADGQTALYAGVKKGFEEVRKFFDRKRVNRVVLLSDGMANVGPSTPAELAALGSTLGREGIGVTTIGLGLDYNEDLMTQLANQSEGNHFFARTAEDLRQGFQLEFSVGLDVVAQEVSVIVECHPSVRPVRLMNGQGDIAGQRATVRLNQVYGGREASFVLELEVGHRGGLEPLELAKIKTSYTNMRSRAAEQLAEVVSVRFTTSRPVVDQHLNKSAMADVALYQANEQYKAALAARDRGEVAEARRLLEENRVRLDRHGVEFDSLKLKDFSRSQSRSLDNLDDGAWQQERKMMRDEQIMLESPSMAY